MIKPVNNNCTLLKTEVDFAKLDVETRKELILALHKKGYDEIKITYDKENVAKEIYSFLNEMNLGFEIIKQNSDHLIIRNISNPESEQFNNLFRRIFRISIEYSKKIEEILCDKDNLTNSCYTHEPTVKRISSFCKRIAIKENKKNASFISSIIESLETITREMTSLLREVEEHEGDVNKKIVKVYKEVTKIFVLAYNLYYTFSFQEYNSLKNSADKLHTEIHKYKIDNFRELCCYEPIEKIHTETIKILKQILTLQV